MLDRLGYEKLKEEQEKVLIAFLGGRDIFAALPIGYGKSLCFALLPLIAVSTLLNLHFLQKCTAVPSYSQCSFETPTCWSPIFATSVDVIDKATDVWLNSRREKKLRKYWPFCFIFILSTAKRLPISLIQLP